MHGPAMRLMDDPNAAPVAHHTPIPVPFDWRDAVKAGLDRNVALGVIETVPVGDPVTWSHRMVICASIIINNYKPWTNIPCLRSIPNHTKKTVFDCFIWVSQRCHPPWWLPLHLFFNTLGSLPLQDSSTRLPCFWWRIHTPIRRLFPRFATKPNALTMHSLWADNIEGSLHQAVDWLTRVAGMGSYSILDTVEFAVFYINLFIRRSRSIQTIRGTFTLFVDYSQYLSNIHTIIVLSVTHYKFLIP